MAELKFYLSGSLIAAFPADVVPSPGAEVTFVTQSYKKGLVPGSVICVTVEGEYCEPTSYDYIGNDVVAHIDANGYKLLKAGPPLEE